MSNWAPKPKFMLAEGDTYMKRPDDDTYSLLAVNYLKLDKVPTYNESWAPVVEGIQKGNFFGTTGEILFHNWGIEGSGTKSIYTASIEYTFPLDFAELVWSDGSKVDRQIIDLTNTTAFGTKTSESPSTPPTKSGSASPYGTPQETAHGSNPNSETGASIPRLKNLITGSTIATH